MGVYGWFKTDGIEVITGIKVKYSTKDKYTYMSVLTSNMPFPLRFHFLKKTKAYNKANAAKSIKYFIAVHSFLGFSLIFASVAAWDVSASPDSPPAFSAASGSLSGHSG